MRIATTIGVAVTCLMASRPATAQKVHFVSGANSPEVTQAQLAILETAPTDNVPISDITGAFVSLNPNSGQDLFVALTGTYCGSGGCSFALYEPGTAGWIKIGSWLAGDVVVGEKDGDWNRLLFNDGTSVWRYGPMGKYEPVANKDGDIGVPY
jgi:hypothetical protein